MKLDKAIFLSQMPEPKPVGPIPDGDYQACIDAAEIKSTRDGSGKILSVTFSIIGPNYAGRKVWVNLNIENKNPIAEQIAHEELGRIMRACGLESITDTDQLIGAPMEIKTKTKNDAVYGDKTVIIEYSAITSGAPVDLPKQASTNPYAGQYQTPATEKKAPWAKR
jgi:hypothetical protein